MAGPNIFRRFTAAAPAALNVFAASTDDVTSQTFYTLGENNAILDLVTDPTPAAGLTYQISLFKNGIDTGRAFFSSSLNSTSAGRVSVGPIPISPGNIQFQTKQTAGALTAFSFIVKLATA